MLMALKLPFFWAPSFLSIGSISIQIIIHLVDAEFKTLVVRMLKELSENFNSIKKDMETIKKNQSEMKNILTEIKNKL